MIKQDEIEDGLIDYRRWFEYEFSQEDIEGPVDDKIEDLYGDLGAE
ncbi:hypothetical protein GMJAKD_11415 [Candidatus Electrothrix aarhusensis]